MARRAPWAPSCQRHGADAQGARPSGTLPSGSNLERARRVAMRATRRRYDAPHDATVAVEASAAGRGSPSEALLPSKCGIASAASGTLGRTAPAGTGSCRPRGASRALGCLPGFTPRLSARTTVKSDAEPAVRRGVETFFSPLRLCVHCFGTGAIAAAADTGSGSGSGSAVSGSGSAGAGGSVPAESACNAGWICGQERADRLSRRTVALEMLRVGSG